MPSYDYVCKKCSIEYSKFRNILDPDPGYKCDNCLSDLTRKYLVNNIFNGSGFYSTDKRLDKKQ